MYRIVYRQFARLMQKPDLAMPWPAWHELPTEMPATVALSVHTSVLPHQIAALYAGPAKDGWASSFIVAASDRSGEVWTGGADQGSRAAGDLCAGGRCAAD